MITHLQAALAFALTMMALATVVTAIIEILSRFMRRRTNNLRHMLALVFERSIKPHLDPVSDSGTGPQDSQEARDFAERIVHSPFEPRRHTVISRLACRLGADAADSISREDFLRRLARDNTGRLLREKKGTDTADVVNAIALRFDEVSEAAHNYYTDSSRIVSIMVGVALALAVNIDGVRIYTDFVNDPATAERIAAPYMTALQDAQEEIETANTADGGAANQERLRQAVNEGEEKIDALVLSAEQKLRELSSQGVDIGWTHAPHCLLLKGENRCQEAMDVGGGIVWLISTVITGILIGFGGPFWYNVVTGLMRATQILRGRTPDSEPAVGKPTQAPVDPPGIFNAYVDVDEATSTARRVLTRQLNRLRSKIEVTGIELPPLSSAEQPSTQLPWRDLQPSDGVRARAEQRYRRYRAIYSKLQAVQ